MQKEFNIQVPEFCHWKECEGSWFPVKIFEVSSSRCSDRAVWLASDTWWCTGPNLHFFLQKITGGPWNDHTSDKVSHNWDRGGEHHGFYWVITFWITIHLLIPPKKHQIDAPFEEWTALHWSAVEGNLEVCHRLLIALANPLQVDQAGGSCEVMLEVDSGLAAGNDGKDGTWDLQESPPWIMRLKQEMQRSQIRPCCFWWMQSHFVDGRNWRVL